MGIIFVFNLTRGVAPVRIEGRDIIRKAGDHNPENV